ncbi:MAG: riboflavin biosynthesis protein RibD [Halobacteriovorax sp.]|nr:riboflavin biosynthesis protein RibD [Halobacteriovorax sp.]
MQDMDIIYMKRCFELAAQGRSSVSPNPMVGCVIVRDGEILAEGYHRKKGCDHAERDALAKISDAKNATLYCNLEPCCHLNKATPPCVPFIIEKGITKVVISNLDPNPEVSGKGVKQLQDAGIEVVVGIAKDEGAELNKVFFTNMNEQRAFVTLKFAQTLDGKLSTTNGDSKWISSEASRKRAHQLRLDHDAVLIGSGTLKNDNPSLNIRYDLETQGKTPWRLVLGSIANMNWDANLFSDELKEKTIIITSDDTSAVPSNISSIHIESPIVFSELWQKLITRNITSVLVEGGPKLLSSIIEQNAFDGVEVFIAPRILGDGIAISGRAQELMKNTIQLTGEDIHLSARRSPCSPA